MLVIGMRGELIGARGGGHIYFIGQSWAEIKGKPMAVQAVTRR
jgi:hypothetical protein